MAGALDYLVGSDCAIVIDYNRAAHAVVKGTGKMSAPGISREIITINEHRNEFARKFSGGGSYNDLSFGGNLVVGDHPGQNRIKTFCAERTKLVGRDMLFFLDLEHFFTTDLANDPSSSMQISEFASGEAGLNDAFPITGKVLPNGRLAIYTAHHIEGAVPTLAFVDGLTVADTITDSASGFVTAGFVAGQTLLIFDSTSNDAISTTITAVTAGELTLASIGLLTSEAGVEGMEIHGGGL